MNKIKTYSSEVRKRTVRLIQEHPREYPSLWTVIASIAQDRLFGEHLA